MRRSQRLITAAFLVSLTGLLAGCADSMDKLSSWDPTDYLDFFDTKKKIPGERKPVFPEGVPGLQPGVPKELYKGSAQEQIDQQNAAAAAAAAPPPAAPRKQAKSKSKPPATAEGAAPEEDGSTAAAPPAPKPKKIVRQRTTAPPPDQTAAQPAQPAQPAAPPAQPSQQSAFPPPMQSNSFSH